MTATTFVFIVTISRVVIIKCKLFSEMFLWKETAFEVTSVFSLAELLGMELKFQQSYLGKHSAYYTAQFPILSQVRTQTHTYSHTHRMQNEAAAQNNLPDRLSDTKTHRQKGKSYYMRLERESSNYSYAPL